MLEKNPYITIDEALQRILGINLDTYDKPRGRDYGAIDMLAVYLHDAIEEQNGMSVVHLNSHGGTKVNVCEHRLEFAEHLAAELDLEIAKGSSSDIHMKPVRNKPPKLYAPSLAFWSEYNFGIYVREWYRSVAGALKSDKGISWNDVMVRLYDEHSIGFLLRTDENKGRSDSVHFSDINLWDRGNRKPNAQAEILITLLEHNEYTFAVGLGSSKTQVSRLKTALQVLTGVWCDDPFEWKKGVGWRAKFYLEDRRGDREKRAARIEEHRAFEKEYLGESGHWLMQNRWIHLK